MRNPRRGGSAEAAPRFLAARPQRDDGQRSHAVGGREMLRMVTHYADGLKAERGAAARRSRITAPAYPVSSARGDVSELPAASPLKGNRAGQWSVRVSGNWRVVYRFEDGAAVDVDLIDYH